MANAITLAQKYQTVLDEVYRVAAKTTMLEAPDTFVRDAMQANQVRIPKVTLQGLGDYNKQTGSVMGNVTFEYETHTFTQDRGRRFLVDQIDDLEAINTPFASVLSQFVRVEVVPEVDAYRIATLSGKTPAAHTVVGTLSATTALQAIDLGVATLADDEVNTEDLVIYVTPTIMMYLKQNNLIERQFMTNTPAGRMINREVEMLDGKPVMVLPQSRMYTAITQNDGTTSGQEGGGYVKNATTGRDINFLIVDAMNMLAVTKTAMPKIFDPQTNQGAWGWLFDYRLYHDLFVPDNKVNGLYLHHQST